MLDTAALIAGTDSLYALGGLFDASTGMHLTPPAAGEEVIFYSIPEVLQEVRDPRARARLSLLQGSVILRAPSSEALASVIEFSKATGDFSVLSITDLKVIALTWMLEREMNGQKYLNEKPRIPAVTGIRCGNFIPFEELDRMEQEEKEAAQAKAEEDDGWTTVEKAKPHHRTPSSKRKKKRRPRKPATETESGILLTQETDRQSDQQPPIDPNHELSTSPSEAQEQANHETTTVSDVSRDIIEQVTEDSEEDNGVGWINQQNLEQHLAKDAGEDANTAEDEQRVGCVTSDFAMQNTMLQMGLKLISVDGRRTIKRIKHFALRCQSCGLVTTELERKWCDKCGNACMHRVAFKVSKDGVARAFLNPRKKAPVRGTKYPIPMPRGGRHNTDLILREDQIDPMMQRRLQKQRDRLNVDVLDPGNFYNAGARFNPNNRPLVIGYGRRNPNENRSTSRSKK